MPGHKGPVVIRAEIVPVFHDEQPFDGAADLLEARQHAVGEDVFIEPRVASVGGFVAPDGMEQEDADRVNEKMKQGVSRAFGYEVRNIKE